MSLREGDYIVVTWIETALVLLNALVTKRERDIISIAQNCDSNAEFRPSAVSPQATRIQQLLLVGAMTLAVLGFWGYRLSSIGVQGLVFVFISTYGLYDFRLGCVGVS